MDLKEYLTNEKVSKRFNSQFELVTYAIKLAANMIQSGRESRVKIDSQNRAMQILNEILNNKDQFDEIIETPVQGSEHSGEEAPAPKATERKKNRKILME